jgi:hypothetical protein
MNPSKKVAGQVLVFSLFLQKIRRIMILVIKNGFAFVERNLYEKLCQTDGNPV